MRGRARDTLRLLVAFVVVAGLAACSSGSSKSTGSSSTSSCPFSGSTQPQSQPGSISGSSLTKLTTSKSGCVDNITFAFTPTLASSQVAYQNGSTTVLLARFPGATLAGGVSAGPVSAAKSLNYVKSMQISAPAGEVDVTITLSAQKQFLLSSSQVPAQLQLAIG